jgi:alditol oxidase
LAVERLHEQVSPYLLISEIRNVAADNLWMSPCYEQACATIHFTCKPEWEAVRCLMPVIEKELAPFQVRPHWGKLFPRLGGPEKHLKKMAEFIELSNKYDPHGKFPNEFLRKNIFGG